ARHAARLTRPRSDQGAPAAGDRGTASGMRVRCTFCGADYEGDVTRAALALVARCEYCRRVRLESAEEGAPPADDSAGDVGRVRSLPSARRTWGGAPPSRRRQRV